MVGEIETVSDSRQETPSNELFHALRGRVLLEAGGAVQELELELATDGRGHAQQRPALLAQPLEATPDDLAHALRSARASAVPSCTPRIVSTIMNGFPSVAAQTCWPSGSMAVAFRPRTRNPTRATVSGCESAERWTELSCCRWERSWSVQRSMALSGELFVAGREDDEDSLGPHPTAQECQQPHAQLVRPVQIFQDEEQRLPGRKLLE